MSNEISAQQLKDLLATPSGVVLRITDPVEFVSTVTYAQIPEQPILTGPKTVTTISVLNVTRIRCSNTGAVTVTNFTGGQQGQEIKFLGDGFTTVANNTAIKTNTAANKLLATNKVYTFTLFGTVWVENA